MRTALVVSFALAASCAPSPGGDVPDVEPPPEGTGDCGDDDPLTNEGWAGFCEDRRDDNCANDTDEECPDITTSAQAGEHHRGCTHDEPCPSTAPGAAAPAWDCTGAPPDHVVASALFTDANDQVQRFCAFVYESPVAAGEYYVAYTLQNGSDPQGPTDLSVGAQGLCAYDYGARRYLYFTDGDADCEPVRYIHAYGFETDDGVEYPVDLQVLSNRCRKAIRLVTSNDPAFDPDVQFFAASEAELQAKLAVLDTAEIGCVGIDNLSGAPYRPEELFVVQAAAPLTLIAR